MKKFVIIMVFSFLIIVLVAFNYVLLDNQNKINNISRLESENAASLSSLSTVNRENERVIEENIQLKEKIILNETQIITLNETISNKNITEESLNYLVNHKLNVLERIKVSIDTTLFFNIAMEFISYIQKGDFLAAHNLIYANKDEKTITLEKMKSHFNFENGIYKINGFEIVLGEDLENVIGEIKFKMNITVSYSKRENNENKNVEKVLLYFLTYDFDDFDSNWLIKDINVLFPE